MEGGLELPPEDTPREVPPLSGLPESGLPGLAPSELMAGAEVLLESLGKGQGRMEQELGAIRADLAHLKELLRKSNSEGRPGPPTHSILHAENRPTFHSTESKTLAWQTSQREAWQTPQRESWQTSQREERPSREAERRLAFSQFSWMGESSAGVGTRSLGTWVSDARPSLRPETPLYLSDNLPTTTTTTTTTPHLRQSYNGRTDSTLAGEGVQVPPTLPSSWPTCLEGRPVSLSADEKDLPHPILRAGRTMSATFVDSNPEPPRRSKWVLDPNSNISLALGACTLLVLCHDMFMIPFVLAWELPLKGGTLASAWVSCMYWTIDMLLGFISGYHRGQEVELRTGHTICHYAKTWFLPDLVVVMTDWFGIIAANSDANSAFGSVSRMVRFAKFGRLVRLLGLLRMTKIVQIFEEFIESSFNDQTRLGLRLFQFFVGIMWMCHLICCSWFAVGRVESDTGMRWTDTATSLGAQSMSYMDAGIRYQYVTALHWSLAQFSLGAIEINCYNSWERIFNMVCILVGLVCGSVLVGTLSATMVDYQMLRKEHAQKLAKLRRYLRENRKFITKATAMQVQQQAVERLKVKEKLQENDVQVLHLVSGALRSALRFEIFEPLLVTHGLFQVWATLDRTTIRRACVEGMVYKHYRPQDEIFMAGESSDRAYHIASGDVIYLQDPETAPVEQEQAFSVRAGTWMSEAALWTHWIHVGTARTVSHSCEVLSITSCAVDVMVEHHPQVGSITKHYAKQFYKCIAASGPPNNPFPDDLEVPHTQFDEIVMSMQPTVQRAVSMHLILYANPKAGNAYRELKDEIRRGKSCVVMTKEGKIQRMVSVVVLNLRDEEGRTFVEICKEENKRFKPTCQFPGKKQEQGEVSNVTLDRILNQLKLTSAAGSTKPDVEMLGMERHAQTKYSDQFGVQTRYLRKVYNAIAREDVIGIPYVDPADYVSGSHGLDSARHSIIFPAWEDLRLDRLPVYVDRDQHALYAWLSDAAFDYLSSPAGKHSLHSWVDVLNHSSRDGTASVNSTAAAGALPPKPP